MPMMNISKCDFGVEWEEDKQIFGEVGDNFTECDYETKGDILVNPRLCVE